MNSRHSKAAWLSSVWILTLLCAPVLSGSGASPDSSGYIERFRAGYEALIDEDFALARTSFLSCLELAPQNSTCAYYLACVAARAGDVEAGLTWLTRSAEWGYDNAALAKSDEDLESLRQRPGFTDLLERIKQNGEVRSEPTQQENGIAYKWSWTSEAPTFSPDGLLVATRTEKSAALWNAREGALVALLPDSKRPPGYPMFSSDGSLLATNDGRNTISLWDAHDGRFRKSIGLPTSSGNIMHPNFGNDGRAIFVGVAGAVSKLDVDTGRQVDSFPGRLGRFFPGLVCDRLVTSGIGDLGCVYDSTDGSLVTNLEGFDPLLRERVCEFKPDCSVFAFRNRNGQCELRDSESGTVIHTLESRGTQFHGFRFIPRSDVLLTVDSEGTVAWWDIQTGACIEEKRTGRSHVGISDVSSDGAFFALGWKGGGFSVWSSTGRKQVWEGQWYRYLSTQEARFSPDGTLLAVPSGRYSEPFYGPTTGHSSVLLYEAATGRQVSRLGSRALRILALDIEEDGSHVAVGCSDGSIRVWDLTSGKSKATLVGHADAVRMVEFAHDGHGLISGSNDGTVRLWDVETASCISVLGDQGKPLRLVGIDGNGGMAAACSREGVVRLLDVETGALLAKLVGHEGRVERALWSPNQERIATFCRDRGMVNVWNAHTGELLTELPHGERTRVRSIAFSPDGALLASAGSDTIARIWSIETGSVVASLEHHDGFEPIPVDGVEFSKDGRLLLSSSVEGCTHLWELATGSQLWFVQPYCGFNTRTVRATFMQQEERVLSSGPQSRNAAVIDASDGTVLASFEDLNLRRLEFSPSSDRIIGIGESSVAVIDAGDFSLLFQRIEFPDGDYLCLSPSLHFLGGQDALDWTQIWVDDRFSPLGCVAPRLYDPKKVIAAASGLPSRQPLLGRVPRLVVESTPAGDRKVAVHARAVDAAGPIRFLVTKNGVPMEQEVLDAATRTGQAGDGVQIDLELEIPDDPDGTVVKLRAVTSLGVSSRLTRLVFRRDEDKAAR